MKRKDLITMTTVALTTATLTVAAFWAAPLEAGGEGGLPPKIAKPKLQIKDVEVTLAPLSGTQSPGDEPVFELAAVNSAAEAAEFKLRLLMTAMSPADALSRVIRVPGKLWEGEQTITLGPNQRKTFKVTTGTKLPAKNLITVTLSQAASMASSKDAAEVAEPIRFLNTAQPGIAVLNFSTTGPEPALASTAPRS